VTELSEAFRIGFLLYLAFVIVDLVIANVLVSLGLQQASPTNIAIPFKLLLFVVLDGWSALLDGLVSTYK
jgi:type III secretion protein R